MAGKSAAMQRESATCYILQLPNWKGAQRWAHFADGVRERLRGEARPTWAEPTGNNRSRTEMLIGSSGHWCKSWSQVRTVLSGVTFLRALVLTGLLRSIMGKGEQFIGLPKSALNEKERNTKISLYRKLGFRAKHYLGAASLSIYLPPGIQSKPSSPPNSLFSAHYEAVTPCSGPDPHASASRHSAPALGSWAFIWVTGWLRHTGLQCLSPGSVPN